MNVLLSIRPGYVKTILSGEKKYEFRKSIFRDPDVKQVFVYSTAPEKKLVAHFSIGDIITGTPEELWSQLSQESGLSSIEFFEYFNGCKKGYAIEIRDLVEFDQPINPWDMDPSFVAPQSFRYCTDFCNIMEG